MLWNGRLTFLNFIENSNYLYTSAGHVIIGNLNVIPHARVRNIISIGPKYRFPVILISLNVVERSLLL